MLVLDISSSVSGSFDFIQATANSFSAELINNNNQIRVSLVYYSDVTVEQPLTNNLGVLQNFIANRIPGTTTVTRTDQGIEAARRILASRGATTVPGSIVVVTDAISQMPTETARRAAQAQAEGYMLFAIGINVDDIFAEELLAITGDVGRLYRESSFANLTPRVVLLGQSLCANVGERYHILGVPVHGILVVELKPNKYFNFHKESEVKGSGQVGLWVASGNLSAP